LALQQIRDRKVETRWSNASLEQKGESDDPSAMVQLLSDVQRVPVRAAPETVYRVFSGIGGSNGWYYANGLWKVRGFIDMMIGGVGLRRGRRHPDDLVPGDALDFWRVESVVPGTALVLRAEMKVPGRAWLEFSVQADGPGRSILTQVARFYPRGVWGLLYWYGVYPLHRLVFRGMAHRIAAIAETNR
jgi:hypothetical protein